MGDEYARRAGTRFVLHCALCAGAFLVASAIVAIIGLWTSLELPVILLIAGVAAAGCAAYAVYLLRYYRVPCPQCGSPSARCARDTLNRQLLVCNECGYRGATGRKVLADSPVGH